MPHEAVERLSMAEQHEWFRSVTSRRALIRGGLAGAGALVAGASVGTGSASAAPAPAPNTGGLLGKAERRAGASVIPFGRHLAYGPDPRTSMSVTWQVPALVDRPFVRIGCSPTDLGQRIPARLSVLRTPYESFTGPRNGLPPVHPTDLEQYYLTARIDHLTPGRTYFYTVGHDGYDPAAHPELGGPASFRTAPAGREKYTFTAFGDQDVNVDSLAMTAAIRRQAPAFHLIAGDLSYANGNGVGHVTDWGFDPRAWDTYFQLNDFVSASLPWQAVVGNHELEPWYSGDGYGGYRERFALPDAEQTTYYSFTHGNVAFLALDANDVAYEQAASLGYTAGAQTRWLTRRLAAFRADENIDFVVAYFHHCGYCTAPAHSSDDGVRGTWGPLFDQYAVDLVINGHNHLYERTDPLKAGRATAKAPIGSTVTTTTHGTTYIVAGCAGDSHYNFDVPDSYQGAVHDVDSVTSTTHNPAGGKTAETVEWSRVRYTGYALLAVDVDPGGHGRTPELVVRGVNQFGAEIDRVTIRRT